MPVWYHPENNPFQFWKIKEVRAGEKKTVREEIGEYGSYGHYKRVLEVIGSKKGGTVSVSQGWIDAKSGVWVDPTGKEVIQPFSKELIILPEKPIVHLGSDWPTFYISLWGLLGDSLLRE